MMWSSTALTAGQPEVKLIGEELAKLRTGVRAIRDDDEVGTIPVLQDNCKVPYDNEMIKAPPAISETWKSKCRKLLAALASSPQH